MDRSSLVDQLVIPRGDAPVRSGANRGRLIAALAVAAVLVGGVSIWSLASGRDRVAVKAAEAQEIGGTPAGETLLEASGYVIARRAATVSSKITGKVVDILIEEGDRVAAGQVIARLDDTNTRAALELARANLAAARAALADTRPGYLRSRALVAGGYISKDVFDQKKTAYDSAQSDVLVAERALVVAQVGEDDTVITAPFAGIVTVKAAQPGEIVSPISAGGGFTRTGIGTIVDMESLEVDVDVEESLINRVRAGMPASVLLDAYPDWTIPAAVVAVIPTADRSKATVGVRVRMMANDPRIVPEMGAKVRFLDAGPARAAPVPHGVLVPRDTVRASAGGEAVVYVITDDALERRTVRLGPRKANGQVVLSGVVAGERVVTASAGSLRDGAKVRVVDQLPQE